MTPAPLEIRSFAKINPALAVLGRRADGYHDIETVFQTIDLADRLEFRESDRIGLRAENLPGVAEEENLAWKAAAAFAARFAPGRGVALTLRKSIPTGAGLGGGSGNAAAVLLGLRRFWGVDAPDAALEEIAGALGSDVPFFLRGGTALGTGRGEILTPLPSPACAHLVVVHPGVHVPTGDAYRSLNLGLTSARRDHRIHRFCSRVKEGEPLPAEIFNDFETSILSAYPPIREAKEFLEARGAAAVLLSGSGSSVFGFFPSEESTLAATRETVRRPWRVFPARTLSRAEYFQSMFG
ncbi:MAG: 4-(cytidine 5'-diphospho)-2-C-methyl-D-erythritol kinase [Acidobacteria bacterium]|mgnify:FL=1|nr:4-(cytidine 5'-diphospho)-2-C-methyl-D-erythritol kinase [Acidobacteriota bacterium]